MSFQINIPPSIGVKLAKTEITENGDSVEPAVGMKKREDWKKLKELEEARKAGTAPAMQDEEGKDINPHIPQYIMQAPWYIGALQPTLKHQREPDEKKKSYSEFNEWYRKGVKEKSVATKFRKGACENCGAMTHKKKECLERPRHIGAKYTGANMAPDEYEQPNLELTYDGKRDRWNGYDTDKHAKIYEEFQKLEEVKRELKAKKLENSFIEKEADEDKNFDDDEDDDKYADDMAMPGTKFETKQRITVRNLRIREDTAKYLYNLDPNSAYYDPKTRSMRENPHKDKGIDPSEMPYAGDNFVRYSGDALEIAKQQMFAWEAYEKGTDVHIQADPTRLELLNKEHQRKKESFKEDLKTSIVEKYGGLEHLNAPPKQLLIAQTEEYVEYSRHGALLKGSEKAGIKSRYEENLLESNHSTVWGSFWIDGMWGYKCCQSIVKGSYCIGNSALQEKLQLEKEKEQEEDEIKQQELIKSLEEGELEPEEDPNKYLQKSLLYQHLEKLQGEEKLMKKKVENILKKRRKKKEHKKHSKKRQHKKQTNLSEQSSEETQDVEQDVDAKELAKAIEAELKRLKEGDTLVRMDDRKRAYNVTYNYKPPTEHEMEAYKRLRVRDDDPMAKYVREKLLSNET